MNTQSKHVLVTGASGFVGTHLVRALRGAGYTVFTHSTRDGDISNCSLSFEDVGHVFHLAARTFVPESWSAPMGFYQVNLSRHCQYPRFLPAERGVAYIDELLRLRLSRPVADHRRGAFTGP